MTNGHTDRARDARRLEDAQHCGELVTPTAEDLVMDTAAGYAVQRHRRSLRSESGDTQIGFKIGLTSAAAQTSFATDEPVSGFLSAATMSVDGDVALTRLAAPMLEVELAFVLGADLDADVTAREVLEATAAVAPAFEIVNSRWDGGARNVAMLVADNSYAAGAVLGPRTAPCVTDLRELAVTAFVGENRLDGHAANVMGDPARAVAWLAAHLAMRGERLRSGDIVLSGTLTTPTAVRSGDVAVADFGSLGRVRADFR